MPRLDSIRSEVQRLVRAVPFRPFVLLLENGERVTIGHPENIAFDSTIPEGTRGADEFYVIAGGLRWFSTFGAVTSIALLDHPE